MTLVILRDKPGTPKIAQGFTRLGQVTHPIYVEAATLAWHELNVVHKGVITDSLKVTGMRTFKEGLTVRQALTVTGKLTVTGGLTVGSGLFVSGTLIVTGGLAVAVLNEPIITTQATITGGLTATNAQTILGALTVTDNLTVTGDLTVLGGLLVTDQVMVRGRLTVKAFSMYLPVISHYRIIEADNGNFELGAVLWDEFSTTGQALIRSASALDVPPYSGQWAVRLGNHDDEASIISQGIVLSKDNACLVYWQWVISDDTCNADYGGVGIDGKWTTDVHSLCAGTATARWVRRQVSMTRYITTSPTVVLNFAATNDYSAPSTMYVDDVAFHPTARCTANDQTTVRATESITDLAKDKVGQPIFVAPLIGVK